MVVVHLHLKMSIINLKEYKRKFRGFLFVMDVDEFKLPKLSAKNLPFSLD